MNYILRCVQGKKNIKKLEFFEKKMAIPLANLLPNAKEKD